MISKCYSNYINNFSLEKKLFQRYNSINMKTTGETKRIKWNYFDYVDIPKEFKKYIWDYQEKVPLEILILRVLTYGDFNELMKIYKLFPEETHKIAFKYPEIKRGVKFWVKRWRNF